MKLCWDNLEGMRLTGSGYLRKGTNTYVEKPHCKLCGEPYLTVNHNPSDYCNRYCARVPNLLDLKFNKLTVKKFAGKKGNRSAWECKCDCGNIVVVRTNSLTTGNTNSCGCYKLQRTSETHKGKIWSEEVKKKISVANKGKCSGRKNYNYKHGLSGTKAYANYKNNKRYALKLNQIPDNINKDKIQLYYTICAYLNEPHNKPMWNVDHIQPLHKGGLHHEDNLQVLDAKLNRQKSDKWPLSEKEMIKYKGVRI